MSMQNIIISLIVTKTVWTRICLVSNQFTVTNNPVILTWTLFNFFKRDNNSEYNLGKLQLTFTLWFSLTYSKHCRSTDFLSQVLKLISFGAYCYFYILRYKYISMTSLFAHTVVQLTKWRFLSKNLNQLVNFLIGLDRESTKIGPILRKRTTSKN